MWNTGGTIFDKRKMNCCRKICPSATLSISMGINSELRSEQTMTNALTTAWPHKIIPLPSQWHKIFVTFLSTRMFLQCPCKDPTQRKWFYYENISLSKQKKYTINIVLLNALRYIWFGKYQILKLYGGVYVFVCCFNM